MSVFDYLSNNELSFILIHFIERLVLFMLLCYIHGRSNGLHDVYAIMLGGSRDMLPWINKTK